VPLLPLGFFRTLGLSLELFWTHREAVPRALALALAALFRILKRGPVFFWARLQAMPLELAREAEASIACARLFDAIRSCNNAQ